MARTGQTQDHVNRAGLDQEARAEQAQAKPINETLESPVKTVIGVVNDRNSLQPIGVNEFPEPYGQKGLHVVRQMTMKGKTVYVIAVSQNDSLVTTATSVECRPLATPGRH